MKPVTESEIVDLIDQAKQARSRAYAPYSGYPVGAAVKSGDGRVFTGVNVENAAYSEALCAERVAIAKAISEGAGDFELLVVVDREGRLISPCGSCRQVLNEFSPACRVAVGFEAGRAVLRSAAELLPGAFKLALED